MLPVGVDGVDGMRSHIAGAMSSKPGMASWGTFSSIILLMIESKRQDKRRYLFCVHGPCPMALGVNAIDTGFFVNPAPFAKQEIVQ
jgi:hypothetical protein